jgi:RecJ-like exonuclease
MADVHGMRKRAKEVADALASADEVEVVGHIDADGITASSIASAALRRAGVSHEVRFVKKLDEDEIARINKLRKMVYLVDLGSGYADKLRSDVCIADHHQPSLPTSKGKAGKRTLFDFDEAGEECALHLNPHLFGGDGSRELCGAGASYLVAKEMSPKNVDLAPLAVVGAVGDFQDADSRKLIGLNTLIVKDATEHGLLEVEEDLRLFGRETRPVAKLLQYSSDPSLPGLSGKPGECASFVSRSGVELKKGGSWATWSMLDREEKKKLISALVELLLDDGREEKDIVRLVGECYRLPLEEEGSELRDAKEFSTLLNSCGRYGKANIGLEVCCGDRGEHWQASLRQLRSHRENIAEALDVVKKCGVERAEFAHLQYIRGVSGFCIPIEDTVVGIVAGMLLGSGEIPDDRPIVAFAESAGANGEMKTKASARGTKTLVERGLDLSKAMKEAAEACAGTGGGHNIAAGATIPEGREREFLGRLDEMFACTVRK